MHKTISVDKLRPGMHVHKLCGPWINHPFWRTSFKVEAPDTINTIIASGITEIIIDTDLGADVPEPVPEPPPEPSAVEVASPESVTKGKRSGEESVERASLAAELVRAKQICFESKDLITAMFNEARMGRALDAEAALPMVEEISASVLRNPAALISVARLKTADDYSYMHSVAVCALMVSLARELGMNVDQVREAGFAGLLHDMGKARMPPEVLNKPGKLTEEEYAVMQMHPMTGHQMLVDSGIESQAVLDVVLHHHERMDGAGYPKKLSGDQISLNARMGAICDVYDAITSNRPYKAGWDPAESIQRMTTWKGHFDRAVLKSFIKSIGIYPIGGLVRLESEKLGVVIEQHSTQLLKPVVQVFYSAKSRSQILIHRVDLAAPDCQDRILGVESPAKWGFKNLERLWMP